MKYFGNHVGLVDGRTRLAKHLGGKHTKDCIYYSTSRLSTVCSVTNHEIVPDRAKLKFEDITKIKGVYGNSK